MPAVTSAWNATTLRSALNVTAPVVGLLMIPVVPVTLETPLPPPPEQPEPQLTVPVTFRLPVTEVLPWTSSVDCGVAVPMPTLTLLVAPFCPAMLPKTRELLAPTTALEPMAVALVRVPVESAANEPTAVLLDVVRFDESVVSPAKAPSPVLKDPVVFWIRLLNPPPVLLWPVLL